MTVKKMEPGASVVVKLAVEAVVAKLAAAVLARADVRKGSASIKTELAKSNGQNTCLSD